MTSSAQTPEPTDEQLRTAAELLDCEEADDAFPYCDMHGGSWPCADMTRVARALASQRVEIVARYEAVAEELDRRSDEWGDGFHESADRIREAAPK